MSSRLALVMSTTALAVAVLGSTPLGHAVASQVPRNSVGPLQLKRNAVGPSKVAPNAIRTGHVLDGSLLSAAFKSGQIPQGPKGDKGDTGAPGVSQREIVVASSASDSSAGKSVTATCPSGKQAIGGGAGIVGEFGVALMASTPAGSTGWVALAAEAISIASAWSVTSYAICARVT